MTTAQASERTDRFAALWHTPTGLRGFFTAVNHKAVGTRYMITAFAFFLVGGVQALLMRLQLAQPEGGVLSADVYNELFTMHGTTMMFLFVIPFLEGLANYLLPLQLGARDLPYPRYNAFNYWCYLLGGLILYSSFLFAMVPDAGWFAYVPLSGPEFSDRALDFWLFGLTLAEISAIGAAIEIGVLILKMRPAGMTLDRMPILAWSMLAMAFLIVVAFVPLLVASLLLELDRAVGTAFFDPAMGGDPLLWQHLFWIFGHPEVYVMFLPAAGIISHVVQVHAGRRLVAYPLVVLAIVVTTIISLGLWVHHMYTAGLPSLTLSFFTAASMTITLASGLQVFAWVATLWWGRPRLSVPMLYAIGFLLTFVAGGITGVMVASVPVDQQVHDTFFVVAHFHYVLIGGVLFPMFAGLYHWWPKFTGRMPHDVLGKTSFWLVFIGFHTTFFPMHVAGLWGMPRRVYTYAEDLGVGGLNLLSTIGAFVLALGTLVFVAGLLVGLRRGEQAPDDPWGGDSLEWATSSPPSSANFHRNPVVGGRYPLWDPPPHDDDVARLDAFDGRPEHVRASPTTTVLTAEPDAAARLALPTFWPVVPAAGFGVVAVGLLLYLGPVIALGLVVVLVGFGGWALRNEKERRAEDEEPGVGDFPLEPSGARSLTWWGTASGATVALVLMATLTFSALYLQVNSPAWPPEDPRSEPLLQTASAVLLLGACAAAWWGGRRQGRTVVDQRHRVGGVLAAWLGALAVGSIVLTGLVDRLDPNAHAYGSVVLAMDGGLLVVVGLALGLTVTALLSRSRHSRASRQHLLLSGSALLWGTAFVAWALALVVTEIAPRVI